jgi:transposase InsO family protein
MCGFRYGIQIGPLSYSDATHKVCGPKLSCRCPPQLLRHPVSSWSSQSFMSTWSTIPQSSTVKSMANPSASCWNRAIDVAGSIRSRRVIEVLSRSVSVHSSPRHLQSDNGPEFVSRAILKWLTQANIDTAHIEPGNPWQNGNNESFNGKFRDECLAMEWFKNRIDAKIVIENFRRQYNEVRPHSSLGQLTPAEFKRQLGTISHG